MIRNYDNANVRRELVRFMLSFNNDQFAMITHGMMLGLNIDQINMYAHPDIDSNSMRSIMDCIMNGMDEEKIKIIANPKFKNLGKHIQVKIGFEQGLTIEEVLTYAKPEYSVAEMIKMRNDLINNK